MNTTIAVAAITAGSTLAAASLTGYITLIQSKRQAAAERARIRQEARRSAYADLLTACTATWQAIDALYNVHPPTLGERPPETREVAAARKNLDHAMHVACLHGPKSIVRSATALYWKSVEEFSELVDLIAQHHGDSRTVGQIHPRRAPDRGARMLIRSEFVGNAMRATGSDQL